MSPRADTVSNCRWCSRPRLPVNGVLICAHCDAWCSEETNGCGPCRTGRNRHDVRNDYRGPYILRSAEAERMEEF